MVAVTYTLLPATEADARELAPLLRAADRAEVLALGVDPVDGLLESLRSSQEAFTARAADGRIICMAGVCPASLTGPTGVPWLLGSDLVPVYRRAFMIETRAMIGHWLTLFPVLRNRIPADYEQTVRWARWLGFAVTGTELVNGVAFHTIQKEAPAGLLNVRPFLARDLRRIRANPIFERPPELLAPGVLRAIERLPSFTGEIDGQVMACAGVIPREGGAEAWAYFAADSPKVMLSIFNAVRRFLGRCTVPVWALVDQPSERWAGLLGFRPTPELRAVAGGRSLPVYVRG